MFLLWLVYPTRSGCLFALRLFAYRSALDEMYSVQRMQLNIIILEASNEGEEFLAMSKSTSPELPRPLELKRLLSMV